MHAIVAHRFRPDNITLRVYWWFGGREGTQSVSNAQLVRTSIQVVVTGQKHIVHVVARGEASVVHGGWLRLLVLR